MMINSQRSTAPSKLLIATHNPGKVDEFRQILAPKGIEVLSAGDFNLPEPVEDGTTFEENALMKARAAAQATGLPALADDSGLCVNALGGAPGVYTADWALDPQTGKRDFNMAMAKVNDKLGAVTERSAYFICVLALVRPDGTHAFFEGRDDGILVWPPRGQGGHGYDPIFQPAGSRLTFAEMDPAEKHKTSHRARAIAKFLESLAG